MDAFGRSRRSSFLRGACGLLLALPLVAACSAGADATRAPAAQEVSLEGDMIEGIVPQVVGPGVVSTPAIEDSVAFLPDGTLLVARRGGRWGEGEPQPSRIHVIRREGDGYREAGTLFPELASADDPFVSPDGERLVFVAPAAEAGRDDRDLWLAERDGEGWGAPRPLPPPVNSSHMEMGPSLDEDRNLVFSSTRPGGEGSGDLWLARWDGERYLAPVPLGSPVNAATGEWNGFLAPGGMFLIFEASGRPENVSPPGDLYIAWKIGEGAGDWSPPRPLAELNSPGSELNARITPDGRWLVFASTRPGGPGEADLYQVPLALLDRYRP